MQVLLAAERSRQTDKIGTIYIESQTRWGTSDRVELFGLLGELREHDTRLFDLRAKKDLTEKDFATEMLAILGSFSSEKDLRDDSYNSVRTRVNNFKARGSWPTGPHPFGFGKECSSPDGKLLWQWQPISRTKGQAFYPNEKGKLVAGPPNIKIPRKTKWDKTVLIHSSNREFVKTVRLVFELYTRQSLSRRKTP